VIDGSSLVGVQLLDAAAAQDLSEAMVDAVGKRRVLGGRAGGAGPP